MLFISFSSLCFAQPDDEIQSPLKLSGYVSPGYSPPKALPKPKEEFWHGPYLSTTSGHCYIMNGGIPFLEADVLEASLGYHLGERVKVAGGFQYMFHFEDLGHKLRSRFNQHPNRYQLNSLNMQTLALKVILSSKPIGWSFFQFGTYLGLGVGYSLEYIRGPMQLVDFGFTLGASMVSATAGLKCNTFQGLSNYCYSFAPYAGLQLSF